MKIQRPESAMKFVMIVSVSLFVLLATPLSARTTVEVIPWASSILCEGEQIDFEGKLRLVVNEEYDGGRLNLFFQLHYHGAGYAVSTGDEYVAQQNILDSFHDVAYDPPLPTVWVYSDRGFAIGKGSAPNYRYRYQAKVIVADGNIVVDTVEFDPTSCEFLRRGPL